MIVILAKILVPFLLIFNLIPLLIWAERKGCAYIQDRHGPNRAQLFGIRAGGLLHSLSDVIKLMTKEDIIPDQANKIFYVMAPLITLAIACVTYAVIPFAHPLSINDQPFVLQAANLSEGILYILAMSSLGVFGIMLAGWSANNKYALLGGLRSSAQMFSYEIAMGLAILCVILVSGSLNLNTIVDLQTHLPYKWNVVYLFPVCLFFIVTAFAETNRNPFDLAEGESEIVGYHVEYSSMKFAMFFMAEYAHMIIASALIATLFFGGWQVPFVSTDSLRSHASEGLFFLLLAHAFLFMAAGILLLKKFVKGRYGDKRDYEVVKLGIPLAILGLGLGLYTLLHGFFTLGDLGSQIFAAFVQFGVFMVKILFFCWFFIWVRWTLPRFRYDQLMNLGWKVMIPVLLVCLSVVAVVLIL